MRSGRPCFSFATSSSSGKTSMAPRLMIASCSPKSVISVVSLPTNPQAANLARPAALVIHIDDHALEGDVFFGDLELTRQLAQETLDDVFPLHADHRIQWSAHAEIGDIGPAALVINIDDHALEGDVFFGDLELTRQLAQETLDDVFPLHADHRIQWSAHAEIGDI